MPRAFSKSWLWGRIVPVLHTLSFFSIISIDSDPIWNSLFNGISWFYLELGLWKFWEPHWSLSRWILENTVQGLWSKKSMMSAIHQKIFWYHQQGDLRAAACQENVEAFLGWMRYFSIEMGAILGRKRQRKRCSGENSRKFLGTWLSDFWRRSYKAKEIMFHHYA